MSRNTSTTASTLDYSIAKADRMFVTPDGQNVLFTFILVSSLFLLWGFLNGMIDVMDKHFQEELHLTLAQSATVQFAHYLGYFLMAAPAGWLATKLGYKGGIITGLLMVAVGGAWFVPATHIAQFWAFLVGVCFIASGLTFLETVANPYTTVLGSPRYGAARINLAQSCNGIGWIFGPIAGGMFFYAKDASGHSTGNQTLYIPYAACAVLVVLLAIVFFFSPVPDIKTEDDYHLDDKEADPSAGQPDRRVNRGLSYLLLLGNCIALVFAIGQIVHTVLNITGVIDPAVHKGESLENIIFHSEVGASGVAAILLIPLILKLSHHSVWTHPHFSGATLAQFFYVAAQAGIFSFLINYMTSETPAIPASWGDGMLKSWFERGSAGALTFSNQGAANLASLGFFCFLAGRFSGAALLRKVSAHLLLGLYGLINVVACGIVYLKLGWLSVAFVFLSYFFMSIMFPTIFALGIYGLGVRAKRASGFIVMAIMGGAILPKVMGAVGDRHGMSKAFVVPLICFALVSLYGFVWPLFSGAKELHSVKTSGH